MKEVYKKLTGPLRRIHHKLIRGHSADFGYCHGPAGFLSDHLHCKCWWEGEACCRCGHVPSEPSYHQE